MQFDSIGDTHTPPRYWLVSAQRDFVSANNQCRLKRSRNALLENVAGEGAHFFLYRFERLAFPLPDLDCEKLQQMPVVICCGGSSSVGAIHQAR